MKPNIRKCLEPKPNIRKCSELKPNNRKYLELKPHILQMVLRNLTSELHSSAILRVACIEAVVHVGLRALTQVAKGSRC